ncbi:hypothetical protein K0M31_004495 [Melipona bicolor]|uniref:Uncharacterized protein n=1 Tax=Melipona bicolor TaxID=60889 RepID=A0AA40KNG1_9HYME|nr:hypothetical protein K0M31_004495 [Melipona bicolor]
MKRDRRKRFARDERQTVANTARDYRDGSSSWTLDAGHCRTLALSSVENIPRTLSNWFGDRERETISNKDGEYRTRRGNTPIPFVGLARDRKRSIHDPYPEPGKRLNSSRTFFEIVDQEAVGQKARPCFAKARGIERPAKLRAGRENRDYEIKGELASDTFDNAPVTLGRFIGRLFARGDDGNDPLACDQHRF